MYELRVKAEFPAAHHIQGYPGDCARPHGHNWVVEVFARSERTDSIGIAIDFRTLKKAVKEVIQPWDHQDLNLVADFEKTPPTAEQIARISFEKISQVVNNQETWVDRVTIWENDRCSATYFDEKRR